MRQVTESAFAKCIGVIFSGCCLLCGCAPQQPIYAGSPLSNSVFLPEPDVSVRIASLSNCTRTEDDELHLNSQKPVTVIVHGCFASAGRFRALADVFAFHGQQAICFNYDDRQRLDESSRNLVVALGRLSEVLEDSAITIIGHSQGGLIARRALVAEQSNRVDIVDTDFDLLTISSPFGGIAAASDCGSKTLAWLSLGLIKPVCHMVTGQKYRDITANSRFMLEPGQLRPTVNTHFKIETDEVDTCRVYGDSGQCVEDDFVFSVEEQRQPVVDSAISVSTLLVKAGHVEIVGDDTTVPAKLIAILQQHGYLRPTSAEDEEEFAKLLAELYLSSPAATSAANSSRR